MRKFCYKQFIHRQQADKLKLHTEGAMVIGEITSKLYIFAGSAKIMATKV